MTEFKGFFSLKKKAYKRAVNGDIPKSVIIPLRQDFKEDCKNFQKLFHIIAL